MESLFQIKLAVWRWRCVRSFSDRLFGACSWNQAGANIFSRGQLPERKWAKLPRHSACRFRTAVWVHLDVIPGGKYIACARCNTVKLPVSLPCELSTTLWVWNRPEAARNPSSHRQRPGSRLELPSQRQIQSAMAAIHQIQEQQIKKAIPLISDDQKRRV